MRTATTLINVLALSTCLIAQIGSAGEFRMSGVRRALQTLSNQPKLVEMMALAAETDSCDQAV